MIKIYTLFQTKTAQKPMTLWQTTLLTGDMIESKLKAKKTMSGQLFRPAAGIVSLSSCHDHVLNTSSIFFHSPFHQYTGFATAFNYISLYRGVRVPAPLSLPPPPRYWYRYDGPDIPLLATEKSMCARGL